VADLLESSYIADYQNRARLLDYLLESLRDSHLDWRLGGIVMLDFGVDFERRSYLADVEGCTVSGMMSCYCCSDNVGCLNYFDCCCYYFDLLAEE